MWAELILLHLPKAPGSLENGCCLLLAAPLQARITLEQVCTQGEGWKPLWVSMGQLTLQMLPQRPSPPSVVSAKAPLL